MDFNMHKFVCIMCFALVHTVSAEDTGSTENKAPVYEPITQDLSGRLDRVEKILDNRALLDMLELLESLKTEVSALRGNIEVQTHTVEQLKQKQRDLYTDIDRRLQRIESNKTTVKSTPELKVLDSAANQADVEAPSGEQGLVVETSSDLTADAETTVEVKPIAVDPQKAEAVYQRAFKLLKESQYDQAQKAFKDFLKDYPDTDFSDNAQYWLGETNYVMQKYDIKYIPG